MSSKMLPVRMYINMYDMYVVRARQEILQYILMNGMISRRVWFHTLLFIQSV